MLARINIATFRRRLKVACRCLCLRLSSSADLMSTDSLRRKTCLQRITHQWRRVGDAKKYRRYSWGRSLVCLRRDLYSAKILDLVGAVARQRFIVDGPRNGHFRSLPSKWGQHTEHGHECARTLVLMQLHMSTMLHDGWHTKLCNIFNHIPSRFSASSVSSFCDVFSQATVLRCQQSLPRFVHPALREGFHRSQLKGGEGTEQRERHSVSFRLHPWRRDALQDLQPHQKIVYLETEISGFDPVVVVDQRGRQ